jgi:hypothetical protein
VACSESRSGILAFHMRRLVDLPVMRLSLLACMEASTIMSSDQPIDLVEGASFMFRLNEAYHALELPDIAHGERTRIT